MRFLKRLDRDEKAPWASQLREHGPLTHERQQLANSCVNLARHRAKYLARAMQLDLDTATSIAMEWLCEAAQNFVPGTIGFKGTPVKFSTFVWGHIALRTRSLLSHRKNHPESYRTVCDSDLSHIHAEDDTYTTVINSIPDDVDVLQDVMDRDERYTHNRQLWDLMRGLDKKSQYIVMARNGFLPEGQLTLIDTAERLGLTRERVRQIEQRAYHVMRDRAARINSKLLVRELEK